MCIHLRIVDYLHIKFRSEEFVAIYLLPLTSHLYLSRLMGKPTICIGENKDADQLRGNRVFVFATRIVQFLFYINPKFQASSCFLCLYMSVFVGPVRKLHCWFSHEAAHFSMMMLVRNSNSLKTLPPKAFRAPLSLK